MSTSRALAFLLAQNESEQAAFAPPVTVVRSVKVTEVVQPAPVKLNAREFLLAMRNAGQRRNDTGRLYTDQSKVREDSIQAIHAYVGYDPEQLFGVQESAARTKAQREMGVGLPNPKAPTKFEAHRANRTLAGYVHGMPDSQARQIEDLLGREKLAASEMLRHKKESEDDTRPIEAREISLGMVDFEEDRLMSIRADLARFGVKMGNA